MYRPVDQPTPFYQIPSIEFQRYCFKIKLKVEQLHLGLLDLLLPVHEYRLFVMFP